MSISPFYIKPDSRSLAVLDRVRLLVCYVISILCLIGATFNLFFDLSRGAIFEVVVLILFIVLICITLAFFIFTNRLKIFQVGLSVSIFYLMTTITTIAGGYYGLGILYLIISLTVVSFISPFKIGVSIPVYFYILTFIRLKFFSVPSVSIFFNETVRDRFLIFLSIACIMSIIVVYSFHMFIKYMRKIAFTDTLTGVSNRTQLNEFIISFSKRRSGFSLIGIKIMNLQKINSNLGSKSGDEYVKAIISRLNAYLKPNEILGRWSGSLIVLLSEGIIQADLRNRAEVLNSIIKDPYSINRGRISGQLITGISTFPRDTENPLQLVENVNFLLDNPNVLPGDIIFFEKIRLLNELEKYRIIEALNQAKFGNEFEIKFQPKIDLLTKKCVGAEVLLRWNNPILGKISPDRFIPLAEECGIIKSLTRWVINQSFRDIRNIQDSGVLRGNKLVFAINISIIDLKDQEFVDYILLKKSEYNLDQSSIEFEVTEGLLIDEDPVLTSNLKELTNNSFSIAIDDFGTGYSSLSYLNKLNIQNLKLDKSFISDIKDGKKYPVIDAILSMGNSLGLDITAEGVENQKQEEYLRERMCGVAQGWLYSRALTMSDFMKFLQSNL